MPTLGAPRASRAGSAASRGSALEVSLGPRAPPGPAAGAPGRRSQGSAGPREGQGGAKGYMLGNLGPAQRGEIGEPDEPVVSGGGGGERLHGMGKGDTEFGAKPGLCEVLAAPAPVPASKVCPVLRAHCHRAWRKGSGICFSLRNLTEQSDR